MGKINWLSRLSVITQAVKFVSHKAGTHNLPGFVFLLCILAVAVASCSSTFDEDASTLMPNSSQLDSRFKLASDTTVSPLEGLYAKEKSADDRTYQDTQDQYHGIRFEVFVYPNQDNASVMYYIVEKLFKDSKDTPVTEDAQRGALSRADISTLLYAIDNGSNDIYVRVWLVFNKNNVLGISYAGGTGSKDDTNGALSRYANEAAKYAEIILEKMP